MTTAMLESFDSQMFDYQADIDVQMDPSSADPWFQQEDIVLDGPLSPEKVVSELPGGVEVDMDDNIEYEMTDDLQMNSTSDSVDLLDVEVPDASHAPTPVAHDSVPLLLSPLDHPATYPDAHFSESSHSLSESHSMGFSTPQPISEPVQLEFPENTDTPLEVVASGNSTAPGDYSVFETDISSHEGYSELVAQEQLDEGESVRLDQGDESFGLPAAPLADLEATKDQSYEPGFETAVHHGEDVSSDVNQTQLGDNRPGSDENQSSTAVLEGVAEQFRSPENIASLEQGDQDQQSSSDPHEISEGVYIEPPPAVLLFMASSESTDVSLFNAPAPPGNATPHAESGDTATDSEAVNVLFQHHPTLYYEPLSNVFQALREDEFLATQSNILDTELVLDAYDLQLVISEDNVYARDVSLHDLNVLHDGCNFTGPLRLRLQTNLPRFISRYRQLQEQVTRVHIGVSVEEETQEYYQEGALSDLPPLPEDEEEQEEDGLHTEEQPQFPTADSTTGEHDDAHDTSEAANRPIPEGEEVQPPLNSTLRPEDGEENVGKNDQTTDNEQDDYVHVPNVPEVEQDAEAGLDDAEGEDDPDAEGEDDIEGEDDAEGEDDTETAETLRSEPNSTTPHAEGESEDATGNQRDAHDTSAIPPNEQPEIIDISDLPEDELDAFARSSNTTDEYPALPEVDHYQNNAYNDWDDEGDPDQLGDTTWDAEQETESNQSSVTLASKYSKRSFDDLESEEDGQDGELISQSSPGSKRARVS